MLRIASLIATLVLAIPLAAVAGTISLSTHHLATSYPDVTGQVRAASSKDVRMEGQTCRLPRQSAKEMIANVRQQKSWSETLNGHTEYYVEISAAPGWVTGNCTITLRSGAETAVVTVHNTGRPPRT